MTESLFRKQPTQEQLKALKESNPSEIVYLRELLIWGFITYEQFCAAKGQALADMITGRPVDFSSFEQDLKFDVAVQEQDPDFLYDSYIESNLMDMAEANALSYEDYGMELGVL